MRNDEPTVIDRSDNRKNIWQWLLPLLILLLLGLGLLYYFMNNKKDRTADNPKAPTQASNEAQGFTQTDSNTGTITDLASLLGGSYTSAMIGKKVALSNATVDQVIGDRSFTLGSSTDHVYALLSDKLDSGRAEQSVQVKAGETRSVTGTVVKAPDDMMALMNQFQLSQEQMDELKSQGFYVSVTQTSVADTSNGSTDIPTGAGTE